MTPQIFAEMLEAHQWANRRLLDKLESLTPEQWSQELPSSFPSIQSTLAHMMLIELLLLAALTQAPPALPEPEEMTTLSAMRSRWAQIEAGWGEALGALDEAGLQAERTFTSPLDGRSYQVKAWWLVQQLFTHTPYHRGQVTTLLHQVGGGAVQTDPIRYHITKSLRGERR